MKKSMDTSEKEGEREREKSLGKWSANYGNNGFQGSHLLF